MKCLRLIIIPVMAIWLCLFFIRPGHADEIFLDNGDKISGRVISMEDGKLLFETAYAGEITVQWNQVAKLKTDQRLRMELSDGTLLQGMTKPAEKGKMRLKMGKIVETVSFDLAEVKSINPPPEGEKSRAKLKGRVNLGFTSNRGNTDSESIHLDGEFVARTENNRYTLRAEVDRAEDAGDQTVDRSLGNMKYDHFLTPEWFLYSNALFEKDKFKDLNLRTALGMGMGYQFFETPALNLSVEAGLAYINEDFINAPDEDYPSGRWGLNMDKYFFGDRIQFFHFHEGLVGLEDTNDIFIRTRTGLRFPLYQNLSATAQYHYDWDNMPAPGREKSDQTYLFTLGYHFGK